MISHSHKFIFIHIPKTGGTSIEAVLADYGLLLQGKGNFQSIYHKHISAAQLQVMLGAEYGNHFKFSVVRNPWDWLVSMYEYCRGFTYPFILDTRYSLNITDECKNMSFPEWLEWFANTFHMQQTDIISHSDGSLAVDRVYQFEDLAKCVREVGKILDLKIDRNLPKLESSNRKDLNSYYDSGKTIDAVARYFARDVELFDYKFDDLKE